MVDRNGHEIDPTPMPTFEQDPYVAEHKKTDLADDAHPIDDDVISSVVGTKHGSALIHFDLAALQAVAVREVPTNREDWVAERSGNVYYRTTSQSFYELLALLVTYYPDVHIEIENAADLVEAHTRQFLKDVHGYEGDFGGATPGGPEGNTFDPTLCSAMNDSDIVREQEPESTDYGFVDARGLVVEQDTH